MSDAPARSSVGSSRLLVVDDNESNRDLLSRRLKRSGYEVDVAEGGAEALALCAGTSYDAIVLDVMMPSMSGIEVLERLRARWGKTELPVIMATAKTDSVDIVEALNRGANDYVTKPIDLPVLLARLSSHLATKAESAARAGPIIDATLGIEAGTILGERYEIIDKLGEGGFSAVYRAKQLSTGREVALKHALPELIRADVIGVQSERFRREMTLIGQLDHPHIVRLIDYGSIPLRRNETIPRRRGEPTTRVERATGSDGDRDRPPSHTQKKDHGGTQGVFVVEVPYMVLELLEGEALCDLFAREGPLEPSFAVDLVLPVVSALASAHEQGVIHRDVKPSNIMLTRDAQGEIVPKVLDFGIAKLSEPDDKNLTVSASLIGTPQYMAPEQALGAKDVDDRVDQFSVAAVLYEALSGRSPYKGEGLFELVTQVMRADFPRIRDLRPDLAPELGEVVERALSGSRDRRYDSTLALGRALLPFASAQAAARWRLAFEKEGGTSSTAPRQTADSVRVEVPTKSSAGTDPTLSAPSTPLGPQSRPTRPETPSAKPAPEPATPTTERTPEPATKPAPPWFWIALSAVLAAALVASLLR